MTHADLFDEYHLTEDLEFRKPWKEALLQLSISECRDFLAGLPEEPDLLDDDGVRQFQRHLFGLTSHPAPAVDARAFRLDRTARAGDRNPQEFLPLFWHSQIITGARAYAANTAINGSHVPGDPVWCFQRFGASYTRLPDGGWVAIAGEHEDHYDEDFRIYADVTVFDGKGGIRHFIYPEDVFPPTDFHTATRVKDQIWIIGSLGYPNLRRPDDTQVLTLDLTTFKITPIATGGEKPGWIHRHEAVLQDTSILISGGRREPGYVPNQDTFALDLRTRLWSRI